MRGLLMAALIWSGTAAAAPRIEVEGFAGRKQLAAAEWRPLHEQVEVGLLVTVTPRRTPRLGLALDLLSARASAGGPGITALAVTSHELAIGARYRREIVRGVELVAGGGVLGTEVETVSMYGGFPLRGRERGAGAWASAGVRVPVGRFVVGADVRRSWAVARLQDHRIQTGGLHVGATLGFAFGGVR